MDVIFDGPGKLCILQEGVTSFDVIDLYSDWKAWVMQGDNAKYLQAFRNVGGDPLGGDINIAPYYFLTNGWRVRPAETDHDLIVAGNLLTEEGDFPFVRTIGLYQVEIRMVTSSASTVITIQGEGSGLSVEEHDQLMGIPLITLTTEEHSQLMNLITSMQSMIVEGSLTLVQAIRLMLSVLAGKSSGGGTDTVRFKDVSGLIDRIIATVDTSGNRTDVEVDPS